MSPDAAVTGRSALSMARRIICTAKVIALDRRISGFPQRAGADRSADCCRMVRV
jgi:hypothetical protein